MYTVYSQNRELRNIILAEMAEADTRLDFRKADLNLDQQYPVKFNPDEVIEVRFELGDGGVVGCLIRNQTIAQKGRKIPPEGRVVEVGEQQVRQFIASVDPIK